MSTEVRKEYANARLAQLLADSSSWDVLMRDLYAHELPQKEVEEGKKDCCQNENEVRNK